MKVIGQTFFLLLAITFVGCNHSNSSSSNAVATNLSVVVWTSFPTLTDSYRHLEHLTNLLRQANTLIATDREIFSQSQAHGQLKQNSPLRKLLNIPMAEPAEIDWAQSMDYRWIRIYSSNSSQRFGWIKLNLHTGEIEAAYDIEALFTISEIEHGLRQIVGTREEALRLFGGRQPERPSPEQQRATKAIAEALLLPPDTKLYLEMSAPGGSNSGQGYLRIYSLQSNGQPAQIASAFYGIYYTSGNILTEILSESGLVHRKYSYRFGGLTLHAPWTSLNIQRFLLDTNGYPYPQIH